MENWNEIREEYARGGVTQKALAERYGVPAGTLRRRAAEEGWTGLRAARAGGRPDAPSAVVARTTRQLALTDRLLDIVSRAVEDHEEFYRRVEFCKGTGGSEFVCSRTEALDEDRLARCVKLVGELFEQQRLILGIHEYRDELSAAKLEQEERLTLGKLQQDERLALDKLTRQTALAEKKLELELLKLDGGAGDPDSGADGFLAALGLSGGEEAYERQP